MKACLSILALTLAAALPGAAQALPGELQVNEEGGYEIRTAAGVRRELARCLRAGACQSVYLETCQMCILSAQARQGGFMITTRLGPPGPEYNLYDNRPRQGRSRLFAAREMIEIFAAHISGRRLRYVGATEIPDETTQ